MFTGHKLPLTLAFFALVAVAFGVGCRGFFLKPTLTSIVISPTSPQVNAGNQITLQAFGTFDDGTRQQVRNGVSWSSASTDVATINPNSGVLTGIAPGSSLITADAQGLEGSATATVLLTGVNTIKVSPTTGAVTVGGSPFVFTFTASNGQTTVNITSDNGGILTITPSSTEVTCTADDNLGQEDCSATTNAQTGNYQISMSYNGSSAQPAVATLTVNPQ